MASSAYGGLSLSLTDQEDDYLTGQADALGVSRNQIVRAIIVRALGDPDLMSRVTGPIDVNPDRRRTYTVSVYVRPDLYRRFSVEAEKACLPRAQVFRRLMALLKGQERDLDVSAEPPDMEEDG